MRHMKCVGGFPVGCSGSTSRVHHVHRVRIWHATPTTTQRPTYPPQNLAKAFSKRSTHSSSPLGDVNSGFPDSASHGKRSSTRTCSHLSAGRLKRRIEYLPSRRYSIVSKVDWMAPGYLGETGSNTASVRVCNHTYRTAHSTAHTTHPRTTAHRADSTRHAGNHHTAHRVGSSPPFSSLRRTRPSPRTPRATSSRRARPGQCPTARWPRRRASAACARP